MSSPRDHDRVVQPPCEGVHGSYITVVGAMPTALVIVVMCAFATPAVADAPVQQPAKPALPAEPEIEYGIGFRARAVRVPRALLELFMERAAGTIKSYGVGLELVRRRGNLEIQLGAEVEYIEPVEGVYLEKGKDVATGDEADFLLSPVHNNNKRLGWVTFEFSFLNHATITKRIAFRYGAGLGIGFIRGQLGRYDVICKDATNAQPEPGCVPPDPPFNGAGTYSDASGMPGVIQTYDLPKLFPVVNVIMGIQLRPLKRMTINVEGGIRTVPFFGASTSLFF